MFLRAPALACALVGVALLGGCPAPDASSGLGSTSAPDQFLDYNEFVCHVEPVLIRHCSYLACHGKETHGLRIYSLGKLRRPAPTTRQARSNDPLTADEVELNFESASGMVYAARASDRSPDNINIIKLPLLSRPLAARLGGDEHQGVAVFPAWPAATLAADPEWSALLAWVSGAKQPNPVSADCAAVFDEMGLTPRSR
jgi:hypothetical protein